MKGCIVADSRIVWSGSGGLAAGDKPAGCGPERDRNGRKRRRFTSRRLTGLVLDASRQDRFGLLTSLAEMSFERQEYGRARAVLRKAEDVVGDLGPDSPEQARLLMLGVRCTWWKVT